MKLIESYQDQLAPREEPTVIGMIMYYFIHAIMVLVIFGLLFLIIFAVVLIFVNILSILLYSL